MKFGGPIRVSVESKTQIGWKAMVDLKPKHELTSNKTRDRDTKLNTTNSEKELCKG